MMLVCGFMVYIGNIPPELRWLQWLSYFRYTLSACAVTIYEGMPAGSIESNKYQQSGDQVLEILDFTDATTSSYGFNVGMLILYTIALRAICYLILRTKAKRAY